MMWPIKHSPVYLKAKQNLVGLHSFPNFYGQTDGFYLYYFLYFNLWKQLFDRVKSGLHADSRIDFSKLH